MQRTIFSHCDLPKFALFSDYKSQCCHNKIVPLFPFCDPVNDIVLHGST